MQQKYLDQFYDLYEVRWRSMDATAMKWRALRWMSYSAAPTVQFPPAPPQDFHIVKLPLLEEEVRGVLVQHLQGCQGRNLRAVAWWCPACAFCLAGRFSLLPLCEGATLERHKASTAATSPAC